MASSNSNSLVATEDIATDWLRQGSASHLLASQLAGGQTTVTGRDDDDYQHQKDKPARRRAEHGHDWSDHLSGRQVEHSRPGANGQREQTQAERVARQQNEHE